MSRDFRRRQNGCGPVRMELKRPTNQGRLKTSKLNLFFGRIVKGSDVISGVTLKEGHVVLRI